MGIDQKKFQWTIEELFSSNYFKRFCGVCWSGLHIWCTSWSCRLPWQAIFVISLFFQFTLVSAAFCQSNIAKRLEKIIKARQEVSLIVSQIRDGKSLPVFEVRSETPKVPASVMKVLTTWHAFDRLGADARFVTKFYQAKDGMLYIIGDGDPGLTTEKLWIIARQLRHAGVTNVTGITIHDSLGLVRGRESANPYGAPVALLSLNFNSRGFLACRRGAKISVAAEPWENHPAPIGKVGSGNSRIEVLSRKDADGEVVSGKVGQGCSTSYISIDDPGQYFGKTLQAFLVYLGVRAHGPIKYANFKVGNWDLLHKHLSEPLHQLIRSMNLYSNNIIAEQLTTLLGSKALSPSERHRDSLHKRLAMVKEAFPGSQRIALHDGSGLSRDNLLNAKLVDSVLGDLVLNSSNWLEFMSSLPSAGKSGTLKSWSWNSKLGEVRAKTGTLNGVRSLAGFIRDRCSNLYSFAMFQSPASPMMYSLEQQVAQAIAQEGCRAKH